MGNQVLPSRYQPHQKTNSQPDLKNNAINNTNNIQKQNTINLMPDNSSKDHYVDNNVPRNFEKQQKMFGKFVKLSELKEAFRVYAHGSNVLSLDKFNECIISLLQQFDIPSLYQSYLTERLFKLMDTV
jgi:hypothetical protein